MPLSLADALGQLGDRSSSKRRSAAKVLRKLGDPGAGPALMAALEEEVKDPRTWETQYQMVMALAECRHRPAMGWLRAFAATLDDPLMLAVGVGDAVVRLAILVEGPDEAVRWALAMGNTSIADGAFRALAMTRTIPTAELMSAILAYLNPLPAHDGRRFWVATAAVDWDGDAVRLALWTWSMLPRPDVAEAARASLAGEHIRHRPI